MNRWLAYTKEELTALYRRAWGPGWPDDLTARRVGFVDRPHSPNTSNGTASKDASLKQIADVFKREHAGIAACSGLIHGALSRSPDLRDVEQSLSAKSPYAIAPCMEKGSLRAAGIDAPEPMLEFMIPYPRSWFYAFLRRERQRAATGNGVHTD